MSDETRRERTRQALRAAIWDHAEAHGVAHADCLIDDFIVVVHWAKIDGDGYSRYSTHTGRATLPDHVALGLLQIGVEHVTGCYGDEDDD